ncbi:MAG: ATP-dependent DNA helicase RecQ [Bacteroidia bacterium]|nr:ATP-dependent DNA helicase RecQ [Bacteroidia bacterium]
MAEPIEILQQYWGYSQFRPLQAEIAGSALAGRDTLALLPTGGGKSVCFQVPALCRPGMALVISPLIALMKDQVERLLALGIPAAMVNSSMSPRQIDAALEGAARGEYRFLYLSPERVGTDEFRLRLPRMPVTLLAVDEAHCISQWGYDFRPAYLLIARIRELRPELPILALTASAPPEVQTDIVQKLGLRNPAVFRASFRRPNLRYVVLEEAQPAKRILEICLRTQGSGIVYVRTRRQAETLGEVLAAQGIAAAAYHGGMKTSLRSSTQQAWIEGRTRVMVATNAFGMGIDKPDVRFVLHLSLPADLESYYQEAGRGGRDGQTALAVAFRNAPDVAELRRWAEARYPDFDQVQHHYQLLCNHFSVPNRGTTAETAHPFLMPELSAATGAPALQLYASIRILHQEGLLWLEEDPDDFGYIQVLVGPDEISRYRERSTADGEALAFILRTMGGEVYTRERPFLPDVWARRLDLPPEQLDQQLLRLEQRDLIRYRPATDRPSLRFLRPRQVLTRAALNWGKYDFLRERSAMRLQEMIRYVENTEICRSMLLQRYFGEQDAQRCGVCDVCIGRTRRRVDDGAFEQIRRVLMEAVAAGGARYQDLVRNPSAGSPAQREQVLRYLLDKGVIRSDAWGNLHSSES